MDQSTVTVVQWGAYATGIAAILGLAKIGANISHKVQQTSENAEQVPAIKADMGVMKADMGTLKYDVGELKRELGDATEKLKRLEVSVTEIDRQLLVHQGAVNTQIATLTALAKTAEGTANEIRGVVATITQQLTRMAGEFGALREATRRRD